ncbi:MAG: hypothetical protein Kow00106_19530 [Anaerolineae bacterium]
MPALTPPSSQSARQGLRNLVFRFLTSDGADLLWRGWELLRRIAAERATGPYEVLDFEHTLELCDKRGKRAIFHKRETVRLVQDYVAAYVDEAWGRGEIFADYRCSPGVPVDRYRRGHRHCTLISLRQVYRRGDILRIQIDRTVHNGFDLRIGWSETAVHHRTRRFQTAVIFPVERPPQSVALLQANGNRTTPLGERNVEVLADGRHRVFWETTTPRLFETYTLRWTW